MFSAPIPGFVGRDPANPPSFETCKARKAEGLLDFSRSHFAKGANRIHCKVSPVSRWLDQRYDPSTSASIALDPRRGPC